MLRRIARPKRNPGLARRKSGFGGHRCELVDGGLRVLQVGVCTSAQQGFHKDDGRPANISRAAGSESFLYDSARQPDRPVEIAGSGLLLGETDVDEPSRWHREALVHGGFACPGKHGKAVCVWGIIAGHERKAAHEARAR